MARIQRTSKTEEIVSDPRYRDYFDLFNERQYFECHEVLEKVWLEESGPDKLFLQGLIQLAVALHHLGRGNAKGAKKLLKMGSEKLASYPAHHAGLDVSHFVGQIREYVEVRLGSPDTVTDPPRIQLG